MAVLRRKLPLLRSPELVSCRVTRPPYRLCLLTSFILGVSRRDIASFLRKWQFYVGKVPFYANIISYDDYDSTFSPFANLSPVESWGPIRLGCWSAGLGCTGLRQYPLPAPLSYGASCLNLLSFVSITPVHESLLRIWRESRFFRCLLYC